MPESSATLHLQGEPATVDDVPRQVLAVSQAVAEVGCVEDVVHSLQDLLSCRELFLHLDVLIFKLCGFQDDTAFRIQASGSSKAENPVDSSKGSSDEVALVFNWCSNPLVTKGDGVTCLKAW